MKRLRKKRELSSGVVAADDFGRTKLLARNDPVTLLRAERTELPILFEQCVRDPECVGKSFAQVVADFERIARVGKVKRLQEHRHDFEARLAAFNEQIPPTAAK